MTNTLLLTFALTELVLAAVGIYGVIFSVIVLLLVLVALVACGFRRDGRRR